MSTMEPSVYPQAGFPDGDKVVASPRDISASILATAASNTRATGSFNAGCVLDSSSTSMLIDGSLRDSSHFSVGKSPRKKKKKKGGKIERKDSKKRKSKSSSKQKSSASSSSLMTRNDHGSEGLRLPFLSPGTNTNELVTADNTWENDVLFDNGAVGGAVPTNNKSKHQPDQKQSAVATLLDYQTPQQRQRNIRRASTGKPPVRIRTSSALAFAAQMPSHIHAPTNRGNELEPFGDENMSVLTGDEQQHIPKYVQTDTNSKDEHRHRTMMAAKQALSARTGNGDSNIASDELLIKYMMAMGTNRDVAEEVTSIFQSEHQTQNEDVLARGSVSAMSPGQHSTSAKTSSSVLPSRRSIAGISNNVMSPSQSNTTKRPDSIMSPGRPVPAATGRHALRNKLQETERRRNTEQQQQQQQQHQQSSRHDSISGDCDHNSVRLQGSNNEPGRRSIPRHSTATNTSNILSAVDRSLHSMIQATPVTDDDIESNVPIAYANSMGPVTFKNFVKDHPTYFFCCVGALVVVGTVLGIMYITVFNLPAANQGSSSVSSMETRTPTMAPSLAPTLISNDILFAAVQLSGGDVLSDLTSPQFKAVAWMSSVDQMDTGGIGRQDFAQRYALTVAYFSFRGEEWIDQENWLRPDLHECEWCSGIVCDSDGLVLTGFDATRNNLHGTIPPEIGLLSSSKRFLIPKNNVGGTIPTTIGKMTAMSTLDLSDNQIMGAIPASCDGAIDLVELNLSKNQLTSTIPIQLYNLKLLRTLELKSNRLSGTIPSAIKKLTSLVTMDLRENQFSGTMSVKVGGMKKLDFFLVDYNRFSGTIPPISSDLFLIQKISASHNQLSGNIAMDPTFHIPNDPDDLKLSYIDLSYNQLSGPINQLLGFLPTLRHLDLSGNQLSGPFNSNVGFDSLEFLALGNNKFSGTVPVGYSTLTHLDFSNNELTRGVPEALCGYPDLEFLLLSKNQLNSTIPECLGDMSDLRDLEFADCGLTGSVPAVLGQLNDLAILDLSSNSLTSTIPTELGDMAVIEHLKLQDNLLAGPIPSEIGSLVDLKTLNLTGNILTGIFPPELEALEKLESLLLQGNAGLRGEIPPGMCSSSSLELLARDIGCEVVCNCCSDLQAVCSELKTR